MPLRTPLAVSLTAALTATAAVVALAATPAAASVGTEGIPSDLLRPARSQTHHLMITVSGAGDQDGTYELSCSPTGGTHPEPREACDAIGQAEEPFAATPSNAMCTYVYGGEATAEVTGSWNGQPVRATFDRSNGCEIARWDRLVPALPRIGGHTS
ncbi:SSI family serine proteinase inhibitor [Streptomyces sp. 4N509B]|uniref:SSI family serine proteinase inhibitor n=1 Tax=Streptomyces sp. 4N509B TaxID=3457413 RepID=UPI003FCF7E53